MTGPGNPNVFKGIEINKELTPEEINAIDKLKDIGLDDLKGALTGESISGLNKNFFQVVEAFQNYVTIETTSSTDDNWNQIDIEKMVAKEGAPSWLTDIINNPDQYSDLAYLIYKLSEFFEVEKGKIESKKITKHTQEHLTSLKAGIEAHAVKNEVEDEVEDEVKDGSTNIEKVLITIKEDDININTLRNGVTKAQIAAAVQTLSETNPQLASEIVELLKTGEVKDIQLKLGMEEGPNIPLYKRADGFFGKRTLENLKVGKVIEIVGGGSGGTSGSGSLERIIVSQTDIDTAVATITNATIKKEVEGYITAKKIKELQQYISDQTDGAHPQKSKKGGKRDGILGPSTLEGIKALEGDEEIVNDNDADVDDINTSTKSNIEELLQQADTIEKNKKIYYDLLKIKLKITKEKEDLNKIFNTIDNQTEKKETQKEIQKIEHKIQKIDDFISRVIGKVGDILENNKELGNDKDFYNTLSKWILKNSIATNTIIALGLGHNKEGCIFRGKRYYILDKGNDINVYLEKDEYEKGHKEYKLEKWKKENTNKLVSNANIYTYHGGAGFSKEKYPDLVDINFGTEENAKKFIDIIMTCVDEFGFSGNAKYKWYFLDGVLRFGPKGFRTDPTISSGEGKNIKKYLKHENRKELEENRNQITKYLNELDCWKKE